MTTLNEMHEAETGKKSRRIELITAADTDPISLLMVIDGKMETFTISRSAAANAISRIAEALSKTS